MNKRKYRDILNVISSLLFFWLYIPHLVVVMLKREKRLLIFSDIKRLEDKINIKLPQWLYLLCLLHKNSYYRTVFYYRIGPVAALLLRWWRPGDRYFNISYATKIGKGFKAVHPYVVDINAESIGDNFSCLHCSTLGAKGNVRPIIGNNVTLGCHVLIIGGVRIGDNVTIGAGSVVVKDIPDNCIAVGNPCKPIKFLNDKL